MGGRGVLFFVPVLAGLAGCFGGQASSPLDAGAHGAEDPGAASGGPARTSRAGAGPGSDSDEVFEEFGRARVEWPQGPMSPPPPKVEIPVPTNVTRIGLQALFYSPLGTNAVASTTFQGLLGEPVSAEVSWTDGTRLGSIDYGFWIMFIFPPSGNTPVASYEGTFGVDVPLPQSLVIEAKGWGLIEATVTASRAVPA